MKLITLNTHSLAEPDYENKLKLFARAALRETPDVIALQEVNQSVDEEPVGTEQLRECGFTQCREVELESGEAAGRGPDGCGEMRKIGAGDCKGQAEHGVGDWGGNVPVRADNHAFRLAGLLAEGGMPCFWTWVPAKIGYGFPAAPLRRPGGFISPAPGITIIGKRARPWKSAWRSREDSAAFSASTWVGGETRKSPLRGSGNGCPDIWSAGAYARRQRTGSCAF